MISEKFNDVSQSIGDAAVRKNNSESTETSDDCVSEKEQYADAIPFEEIPWDFLQQ